MATIQLKSLQSQAYYDNLEKSPNKNLKENYLNQCQTFGQAFIYLRLTQARNYVIYISMEEEKYGLLMSSSICEQQQLGKLISYVFSNQHLYINSIFRRLVEQDRKGYVSVNQLLNIDQIQEYFKEIGLEDIKVKLIFLKSTVKVFCPELHFHDGRVRRLTPWRRNLVKILKPYCINGIKERMTISDIRDYFGEDAFTTNAKIQGKKQEDIMVYLQSGSAAAERLKQISLPFLVLDYSKLCRDRARQSRFWQTTLYRSYRSIEDPKQIKTRRRNNSPGRRHDAFKLIGSQDEQDQVQTHEDEIIQFQSIVKNPNPSFNSLLQNFIKKNEDPFYSSSFY